MKKPSQGKPQTKPDLPPPPSAPVASGDAQIVKALSAEERERLAKLEGVIDAKLSEFFEVGSAIMEIKTRELYRESHRNFDLYCQDRWGFGRSYANKLIGSAERLRLLPPSLPKPANEFQIRPFLKLEPEEFPKKWEAIVQKAGDGKRLTSKIVEESLDLPGRHTRRRKAKPAGDKAGVQEVMEKLRAALKDKNIEQALKELARLEKVLKG